MLAVVTIIQSIIILYIHLYQFVFHLGILFTLISTTYTTSTITSIMYTQSTSVYSTVISTLSTTNTSCVTLCTAGMLCKFYTYKILCLLQHSRYTNQYVPLFSINCCYCYAYCLSYYEKEELQ